MKLSPRIILLGAAFLSGCAGPHQSMIDSAGGQARRIEGLWWLFFWLLTSIFVIVIAWLAAALLRSDAARQKNAEDRKLSSLVTGAGAASVIILIGLIVISVVTGQQIADLGSQKSMVIEVTGNQWWWYVRYAEDIASRTFVTANEIHLPVGRVVMIKGTSQDVIHSLWMPNIHGKRDLIPSRTNTQWIEADRPGRFRGQCAEFCGTQHARMAFWVVAEPPEQFEAWAQHQRQPAVEPTEPVRQRGKQVFLNSACVLCHSIGGTTALGQVAPDLTHFGSRLTIAAGTLPNNKGNLAGWIADPQTIKPGNHMATVPVKSEDLQPLVEYLESLQ